MQTIKNVKGLKYPDEYITKFFYKKMLHEQTGSVIEFGCSNGNNLSLFYQYDYTTTGVDLSTENINNATFNFQNVYDSNGSFSFYNENMLDYIQKENNVKYDVFMIPNVISYLTKSEFISFLQNVQKNKIYKKDATFFLRTRTIKDYRFGQGVEVEPNSFKMNEDTTGEKNAICTCYEEHELIDILREYLNLKDFSIYHLDNQNDHSGRTVLNSDIAIWGTIS